MPEDRASRTVWGSLVIRGTGVGSANADFAIEPGSGAGYWDFAVDGTSGRLTIFDALTSTNPVFIEKAAPSNALYIDASGRVGLGQATPTWASLCLGTQTVASSASPKSISLGGTYSSTAAKNLKIKVFDDATAADAYGLGVSGGQFDYVSGGSHAFYANGTTPALLCAFASSGAALYVALDMQSHQVHNVTNPTSAQDAATKSYTDPALRAKRLYTRSVVRGCI